MWCMTSLVSLILSTGLRPSAATIRPTTITLAFCGSATGLRQEPHQTLNTRGNPLPQLLLLRQWGVAAVPVPSRSTLSYFSSTRHRGTEKMTSTVYSRNDDDEDDAIIVATNQRPPPPPPPLRLIDVDCNLWHKDLPSLLLQSSPTEESSYDQDCTVPKCFRILQEDNVQCIVAMLSPSSTLEEAAQGIAALERLTQCTGVEETPLTTMIIKTTVGVHPYHVNDDHSSDLCGPGSNSIAHPVERARKLLTNHRFMCVAVGECGLDESEGFPSLSDQIPWFEAQIALAVSLRLPLFVHERLAFQRTMDMLRDVDVPVIIHCFTGTAAECQAYMDSGYSVSISGYIFRDEANDVRQCLEQGVILLDRLMIETDAPYMGFAGCRDLYIAKHSETFQTTLNAKKRKQFIASKYPNPPSSLNAVLIKVLWHINRGRETRGEDLLSDVDLAKLTSRNANAFFQFGLDDDALL